MTNRFIQSSTLIFLLIISLGYVHNATITEAINDLLPNTTLNTIGDINGDPLLAGSLPPYPAQSQPSPGLESQMIPKPDFGYTSYNGSGKLQGKVAIITGGDSGIGRAVALAFAREGASIVISYLNETEDAEEIQRIIQTEGGECLLIPGDISEDEQCKKIVNETVKRFERIDILVNNAAYFGPSLERSIEDLDHDRVLYAFKTNIIAMFDLVRYALPYMPRGSSIINTASQQAYQPNSEIIDYAVTKAANVAFTKGLAKYLSTKGIRINCVAPGPIWTPMVVQGFKSEISSVHGASTPMKRAGQPRELAPAYVFLASNKDSSYISGETIGITGGVITV